MIQDAVSQKPVEIFISYSRHDKQYADELKKHLRIYEISGRIRVWYDGNLNPGEDWEEEIYSHFCSASIILLLVSPDFFASAYCIEREMPEALKRHADKEARVVPVIIRPVEWQRTELKKLNVLPQNSKPIDEWDSQDQYYRSVTRSLFEQLDSEIGGTDIGTGKWGTAAATEPVETPPRQRDTPAPVKPDISVPVNVSPTASAKGSPVQYRSAVEAFVPEIVVCFLHPERRKKLLTLRKWCQDTHDPLFGENAARVVECTSLEKAVRRVTADAKASESILLLDGFEPGFPQLDECLGVGQRQRPLNVIVNAPEWESFATQESSASILQSLYTITSDETLLPALRKSLLRIRTREFATARVLHTEEDFEAFFKLRYRVWDELGYLSDAKRCPATPWELDYTDRTALPLGIFSKLDGTLIGGARLVRGLGEEYPTLIRTINEMLRKQGAEVLRRNFEYPTFTTHPFDILGEFQRFQEYYRDLVRRGVSKAEVSRVVVEPEYRKLGLGEVIVDTLCSLARVNAVEVLFLACHEKHGDFYKRSHFKTVGGVSGDSFLTYRVPCIAMERHLPHTNEPAK
ncbi:MAG: GNAT family N-acetyltransferase [Planctomycetota bacterium]|nr:GNAT family N-acetyltransferase [Planctomycetota bacterium]